MEKEVKIATDLITDESDVSGLTQCAVRIATIALTDLKDGLREKALNVAKAIAEYEDELLGLER